MKQSQSIKIQKDREDPSQADLPLTVPATGGPSEGEAIKQLIGSIKRGHTIVFCGAGISLHSGIPLVGHLVPYMLDKLAVSQQSVLDDKSGLQIPFETIMGIIVRRSRADRFLDIFGMEDASQDVLPPNLNHNLLARLVKAGYLKTIVTTNFDRLIERALETQGLQSGRDYLVFHDEEGFSRIDWGDYRPRLIKLHGSVEDRKGMAATFEMVERQGLSRASLEVIRHIFSIGEHDDVLVLGYSSSDKFDLTPQIRLCSFSSKNILYVEHSSQSGIEPIAKKGYKDPFMLFEKGQRIFCNTDDLIRSLWKAFFTDQDYKFQSYESRWRDYVDEWYTTVIEPFQHLMAGDILEMVAQFDDAAQRYEAALIHARKTGDQRLQSDILNLLGKVRAELSQYTLARTLYEESLTIAENLRDESRSHATKNLLRNIPPVVGPERILFDLEEALKAARERRDTREEGSLFIDLGNARMSRQEYDKALSCFQQAFDLLWGDAYAAAVILNNMGMAYVKLGQHKLGEQLYLMSIEMDRDLGDRQGEGTTRFILGELYADQKDYEKALISYEQSLAIAEGSGDASMKAQALVGIAKARDGMGQENTSSDFGKAASALAKAIEQQDLPLNPGIQRLNDEAKLSFLLGRYDVGVQQLTEALHKAEELMDRRGEIMTLNNMGIAAVGMNETSSGVECHEQALDLSRQISDRDLEIATLGHLSRLYSHIGAPLNAIRYYEDSVRRAHDSRQRDKEVDYLNLLAKAYYNLGEFRKAINPLECALQLSSETGNRRLEGIILNNLGNIHNSLKQTDKAIVCFQQALSIFQSIQLDDSANATQSALDQMLRKMQ